MKKQWLRKIGLILLSVFVLSLLVFVMSRLAPGDPLVSYYGERVASRILGAYDILKFAGEDIRLKRKSAY